MCVCVTNNVYVLWVGGGMQQGAELQWDSTVEIFSPLLSVCLHFGGRDSQADQSAGGITASCGLQDLVDKI